MRRMISLYGCYPRRSNMGRRDYKKASSGGSQVSSNIIYFLWLVFSKWIDLLQEKSWQNGVLKGVYCVFCRNGIGSKKHRFFRCSHSGRIWKAGMSRCNILNPPVDWEYKVWTSKSLLANRCRLVLSSTMYNIW